MDPEFASLRDRRSFVLTLALFAAVPAAAAATRPFGTFLHDLWPDAAARGIARPVFDAAFAGMALDPNVIGAMQREPEYGKPMSAYLAGLVSPARVAAGQRQWAQWTGTLQTIEQRYGVDPAVIVAIWGVESSFGEARDRFDVFRSLATLAHAGFQHPFFRNELLSALTILQQARLPRQRFVGSWAGAMGQAQFLPSSYLRYAVDFDGDGRADIWASVPDVLASIANYLHQAGWQPGQPWGFEVKVPPGFDYRSSRGTFGDWRELGFVRADGRSLPASGSAIVFFPSGAGGPAFLVTDNFVVIKRYNNSDAYALAVGDLADRLRGFGQIRKAWPADDFQPSRAQRIALERRLAERGYKVADLEGHLDFDMRDALRELQRQFGMIADGYPGRALLERLNIRSP